MLSWKQPDFTPGETKARGVIFLPNFILCYCHHSGETSSAWSQQEKPCLTLDLSCGAWICCCTHWFSIFSFLYFAEFTSSCSWAQEDRFRLFKAASLKINRLKHSPWGSCSCWDFKEEFESLAPPSGSKSLVLTQWETQWWGRILWQGQAGSVPKHTLLFLKESCLMKQMT